MARQVSQWTYSIVMSYVKNEEDAEEIIQDTILSALRKINGFKSESSLKTWVYRIAINKSIDAIKFKNRSKRAGNVISLQSTQNQGNMTISCSTYDHPEKKLISKEKVEILFSGINQLPENQKKALTLTKLEYLSMKEVAGIMDVTPKAVESLLSRGKKNLLNYLENEGLEQLKRKPHGK
ncbi:MAG: RNA polymerase sigma factor [Saprospiraceae bacterium]|nr:RNA polymerase sigma factor [Saprospiraceae bacterium]